MHPMASGSICYFVNGCFQRSWSLILPSRRHALRGVEEQTKEIKEAEEVGRMSDVIREMVEMGIAQGREEGMEKGKIEAQAGNVRNMLADGLPPEQIRKLLRLTEEEHNRLASL